jgi:hypothetical protein
LLKLLNEVNFFPLVLCVEGGDSSLNETVSKESSDERLSKVSSKREQFFGLQKSKKSLEGEIKENLNILSNIQKAEVLDKKLPEQAKHSNSHLNELKEEFSSYFDEDSGNNTTKECLDDIKEYLKDELKSLNSELDKVSFDLDNLVLDSDKNSKRSLEDQDSNETDNKRPRNNDESSTSGSGSLPPSFPSAPSSGSSPSSSSATSSKVVDDGGSVYKSSREDYESNYYTLVFLDFIIFILKALAGDDGDKD